jgi:hypothetical protein
MEMWGIPEPRIQPHGAGLPGQRQGPCAREPAPVGFQRCESAASPQRQSDEETNQERCEDESRNQLPDVGNSVHPRPVRGQSTVGWAASHQPFF